MKKSVKVGKSFTVKKVKISDGKKRREKTRSLLSLAFVIASVLALLVSAAYGYNDGSFEKLQAVWSDLAHPLGWIFGFYYSKGGGGE